MLESLFNKVADLKACNFIIKRFQPKCFPVKFAKFSIIPSVAASEISQLIRNANQLASFYLLRTLIILTNYIQF